MQSACITESPVPHLCTKDTEQSDLFSSMTFKQFAEWVKRLTVSFFIIVSGFLHQ